MRAVIVVHGVVDERDVWPYAMVQESDEQRTTLAVTVHDTQELVGVLSSMTAMGLEVISTHLVDAGAQPRQRLVGQGMSFREDDAATGHADEADR
jgi:hypothetical protein